MKSEINSGDLVACYVSDDGKIDIALGYVSAVNDKAVMVVWTDKENCETSVTKEMAYRLKGIVNRLHTGETKEELVNEYKKLRSGRFNL